MVKINTIAIIAITALLSITASATYFTTMQNQSPTYRPVRFFEQLWGSSSAGGMAMALPWTAVGVTPPDSDLQPYFKPLPRSFLLTREWYGASSYFDRGESLWTFLRSGEVIRFGFNSTEPLYVDCVFDQNYVRQMHTDDTYSYSGTLRIPRSGVYCFDFSISDSVERSVNATVSFRCSEAVNELAIDSH